MDDFWPHVFPSHLGNTSFENRTIDVALKGCFINVDTTACVRNVFLAFIGACTLLLCIIRILKLHYRHHLQVHQYLIFYLASFEVLFLFLKWMALTEVFQLEFAAFYLKHLQFILLCHYHWLLVARILHREKIVTWLIIPILCLLFGILTIVSIMGMLSYLSTWVECLAPHWLILSVTETVGLQLFIVAGMYITRKINSVSALDSFKWKQKRDLWSVILVYAFSSFTSLIYYGTLQALGNLETGCSGIFNNIQEIYSPVYIIFMVIKYLLPVWIMLIVFHPAKGFISSEDERHLGWSGSGSTTSVFTPYNSYQDSYRQLTLPVENGSYWSDEYPTLRRCASSPALFVKPPLTPIWEEGSSLLPPPHIQYDSYGATDSFPSQTQALIHPQVSRTRSCHDSGWPPKSQRHSRQKKIPVSLNQCSDEIQSVTPSSGERA